MIKKIDHIGIAVRDLEAAKKVFTEAFGARLLYQKENLQDKYVFALFKMGEIIFSVLEATSPDSFVARHIERFGEGVDHVAIEVDDLDAVLKHWEKYGFKTLNYEEVPGIRKQVFLSPKNSFGVVFQVLEWLGQNKFANDEERMGRVWS
ncbi:MAG: hypothetical protein HPY81_08375 [Firmicutes bacterium]|nr:hypothetical protein [Bacillota bacterium]